MVGFMFEGALGIVGVMGGISIHSSRLRVVSDAIARGSGGSLGSTDARDLSFRLSAVGIVVAIGCGSLIFCYISKQSKILTYMFSIHVYVLLDPHVIVGVVVHYMNTIAVGCAAPLAGLVLAGFVLSLAFVRPFMRVFMF